MTKEGKTRGNGRRKIFVLDTSVILYDHNAFQNFQEHDVAVPIQVLEELDNMKSGNDNRNFEARSFIRLIDEFAKGNLISHWLPLNGVNKGHFKIVVDNKADTDAVEIFGDGKVDNRILNAALSLQHENPDKKVILVSKDICLRLKAKSLDLYAEDYETGKIKNLEELYTGKAIVNKVPDTLLTEFAKKGTLSAGKLEIAHLQNNHFYILHGKRKSVPAFYNGQSKQVEEIVEQPVFNIHPKNIEQSFAIHALLNPNIKLSYEHDETLFLMLKAAFDPDIQGLLTLAIIHNQYHLTTKTGRCNSLFVETSNKF